VTREGPFWDVMEGRAAPPPAAVLLGWELIAVDPEAGTIEVAFNASEQFLNPAGVIQGGFLAAMLDDTLGPALVATLGPGLFAPTTDLHVQFLRPARPGRLTGRGRIVRRGREVAFLAGELLDDSGQVVATAVATAQVRGVLPAAAVYDLAERPPVRLADRRQRPVGRVAERDEQRPAAVLGEAEQLAGQRQVGDARVAAADAQVGRCQQHRHRRLAQVELGPAERVVVRRSDHHDRGRRAGHVPAPRQTRPARGAARGR
jgi:uncharacterized domain 1